MHAPRLPLLIALLFAGCVTSESTLEPVGGASLTLDRSLPGGGDRATMSASGTRLAALDSDGRVVVVDVASGTSAVFKGSGFEEEYGAIALSPDGRFLAAASAGHRTSGGENYPIDIWNLETKSLVRSIRGNKGFAARSIAYTPDGTAIAAAGAEVVEVYEVANGSLRHVVTTGEATDAEIVFLSPTLIVDTRGYVVELTEGVSRSSGAGAGARWRVTPDRTRIISLGYKEMGVKKGFVRIADLTDGTSLGELSIDAWDASGLAISPDGRFFAVGRDDIAIYRVADGALVTRADVPGTAPNATALFFTPDGRTLIAQSQGTYTFFTFTAS
jgi:WD40 repeat protein